MAAHQKPLAIDLSPGNSYRTISKACQIMKEQETEIVFSYGTLQSETVQLATFGRRLKGTADVLVGYKLTMLRIQDRSIVAIDGSIHLRNIQFTGSMSDSVEGMVFTVTSKELEQADVYEKSADYHRVLVQLRSGTNAWVYLNKTSRETTKARRH